VSLFARTSSLPLTAAVAEVARQQSCRYSGARLFLKGWPSGAGPRQASSPASRYLSRTAYPSTASCANLLDMMRPFALCLALVVGTVHRVTANVEKTIFIGPSVVKIPQQRPTLDDLHLGVLTHLNRSIRTHVAASFPTSTSAGGKVTWMLLDNLTEGQRYEVRICWAATVCKIRLSSSSAQLG
jgi:hypothetical protein